MVAVYGGCQNPGDSTSVTIFNGWILTRGGAANIHPYGNYWENCKSWPSCSKASKRVWVLLSDCNGLGIVGIIEEKLAAIRGLNGRG